MVDLSSFSTTVLTLLTPRVSSGKSCASILFPEGANLFVSNKDLGAYPKKKKHHICVHTSRMRLETIKKTFYLDNSRNHRHLNSTVISKQREHNVRASRVMHRCFSNGVNTNNLIRVPLLRHLSTEVCPKEPLRLGLFNARSVNNKAPFIKDYFVDHRHDLLAVTETCQSQIL